MNFERSLSKSDSTNNLNIIEQAVLHAKSRKQSNGLLEQQSAIETNQPATEEWAKDIISFDPIKPFKVYHSKWQFFILGICSAAIGASVMWGFMYRKTEPLMSQATIMDIKPDPPDPNWSGLKMSYKIGEIQ